MDTCFSGYWFNPELYYFSDFWCASFYITLQYIPRNMHTVFALLYFVVVIHWQIFPYPSGLLHWHCGNLTNAPVPAKQPWWIWINTCKFIMNDCITTTKQGTTKTVCIFLGIYCISMTFFFLHSWITSLSYGCSCRCHVSVGLLPDTQHCGCACAGNGGNVSPSPQINDPDMHHGTCVTHVRWCMPGSLTGDFLWNRRRGKTFPAFPAHEQPAILRIW